ncbi:MAG: serine hydrolase domain-containing protein [Aquabacterium sp.]
MKPKISFFLIGLYAILPGCATQMPPPTLGIGQQQEAIAHLQAFIQHEMQQEHVQGLSIALVSDQTVVWEQGFGWADAEKRSPADARTRYRAGSISKLLTDVGAMELAASGQLMLDAPVRHVLPEFAPTAPDGKAYPITPRMLMTHHSGLPRDVLKGFMSSRPAPFGEVVPQLNAIGADDVPMRSFSYSNAGISVLGAVVARVAGRDFESWMQDAVLKPMGMSDSVFEASPSAHEKMAQGYIKGQPAIEPGLRDVPAGGLTSSVHDLSNFMRMVFAEGRFEGRQILPAEGAKSMLTAQNTQVPLDAGFRVGLGWMLGSLSLDAPRGVGPVAHHAGATRLFHSQMYVLPEQKIGVVVMANERGAHELVDRIALRALNVQLQVQSGHRHAPAPAAPWASAQQAQALGRQEAAAKRWAGWYSTIVGPVRISQTADGSTTAQAFGKTFQLRMREGGARSPVWSLMGLLNVELDELSALTLTRQDINGVEAVVARLGGQEMLVGSRMPDSPVPQAWQQRVGSYRLLNQGDDSIAIKDLRIRLDGHQLILSYVDLDAGEREQQLLLRPLSDTSAQVLQGLPDAGPRVQALTVSGKEQVTFSGFVAERQTP